MCGMQQQSSNTLFSSLQFAAWQSCSFCTCSADSMAFLKCKPLVFHCPLRSNQEVLPIRENRVVVHYSKERSLEHRPEHSYLPHV